MKTLPRLELHYNRPIFAILLVACSLVLLLELLSGTHTVSAGSLFRYFLCAVGIPLGLVGLLDRRPKLVIDEVGVRYAWWGNILVQWAELSHFEVRRMRFTQTSQVVAVPKNPALLRTRLPPFWRVNGYIARLMGLGEFTITAGGLEGGVDQIVAILEHYHMVRTGS